MQYLSHEKLTACINEATLFLQTGVENAFSFSHTVMTVSFHKFEVGFYPGKDVH